MTTVETRQIPAQPVLLIRRRCTLETIQQTLAEVLPATFGFAVERGQQPVGPPFTRYLSHDEASGEIELEGGCPIAAPIEVEGDIQMTELPAGEVAFTWHVGPYDRIGEAHRALASWAAASGRQPGGACWEVYWTDPSQEPDPARWRTEVLMPLAP